MVDYKEMYLEMVRETERAINILINVQRRCEEMYITSEDPKITVLGQPENVENDSYDYRLLGKQAASMG